MGTYRQLIREDLAAIGRVGTDPAAVEAWMRVEHPTLDHLSRSQFRREVGIACECMDAADPEVTRGLVTLG